MPSSTAFCYAKSALEHRLFGLVSQLHDLTSRLVALAGRDSNRFNAKKADCDTLHLEIFLLRIHLQAHRAEHGC